MIRLARCSRGQLGLVLRDAHLIRYEDGTSSVAWTGLHLPRFWRRWSSTQPRWRRPL